MQQFHKTGVLFSLQELSIVRLLFVIQRVVVYWISNIIITFISEIPKSK